MHSLRVRVIIAFVILIFSATVSAVALYPTRHDRGALQAEKLPLILGSWVGMNVEVEEYVKRVLETDDVVQRNYTSPEFGEKMVQMAVVFSPDNRRVAHPPEVCYRGAGWEVNEKKIVQPQGAPPLVRLVLAYGSNRDLVFYCYKSGNDITANYYQQQANILLNMFQMKATSSALIRFSTHIEGSDQETEERILAFIRQMMPEIQKTLN